MYDTYESQNARSVRSAENQGRKSLEPEPKSEHTIAR
jgi:hypothetical protein